MTTAPDTALATKAAEAAAEVLPAVDPLSAAGAQPGNEHVTASFAGAATAQLDTLSGATHRIAVLVGPDGEEAVKDAIGAGLARHRTPDGSYRLNNAYHYLIARA